MLKVLKEDGRYIVSIFEVSKLNMLFSEQIGIQLNEIVAARGRQVIFNLEGVRFIDTAGFRMLEEAVAVSKNHRGIFQLCNVSEEVQELIELTGRKGYFEIIPQLEIREKILMELDL